MDRFLPTGLGPLGLTHEQFYTSTVAELKELMEAHKWRERHLLEHEALVVAHLVQPHIKNKITPRGLFKRWTKKQPTKHEQEHKFETLMRRLRRRGGDEED